MRVKSPPRCFRGERADARRNRAALLDEAIRLLAEHGPDVKPDLALDGLDEHDASAVVAGLCIDLVAEDPGAAIRARSRATLETRSDVHDPEGVAAAYLIAAAIFQL